MMISAALSPQALCLAWIIFLFGHSYSRKWSLSGGGQKSWPVCISAQHELTRTLSTTCYYQCGSFLNFCRNESNCVRNIQSTHCARCVHARILSHIFLFYFFFFCCCCHNRGDNEGQILSSASILRAENHCGRIIL